MVHCLKCKDSLQQAFDCYLTSTSYSHAASSRAKQFFTVLEIRAAVALIDLAVAQIDALTDQNICNQVRLAAGCI